MFKLSIFTTLFFSASLLGMEVVKEQPLEFSVMTYNVCNFWGMANKPETSHLIWENRKERIFTLILDEKPDIIGFQELRDDNGKSIIKDLWNGLGDHGYEIVSFRFNPSQGSYINAIAYNNKKFALDRTNHWWLSDTPNVLSDMKKNGWGNVALMVSLYPITDIKKGKFDVSCFDYSRPIHVANVHNCLDHKIKLKTNRVLVDEITRNTQYSEGIVIITGDFNTLVEFDQKSIDELDILKNAGYEELLNNLKTENGIRVSGTFNGYSYDKYKCPTGMLSGQLDHIFLKKLSDVSYESQSYVNVKRYNGNDNPCAKTESDLLAGLDGKENRDEFPSDHIPGIAVLKVFFNHK